MVIYPSATRLTRSVPFRICNLPFTVVRPDCCVNPALYPANIEHLKALPLTHWKYLI